jgi:hypothetical protein
MWLSKKKSTSLPTHSEKYESHYGKHTIFKGWPYQVMLKIVSEACIVTFNKLDKVILKISKSN